MLAPRYVTDCITWRSGAQNDHIAVRCDLSPDVEVLVDCMPADRNGITERRMRDLLQRQIYIAAIGPIASCGVGMHRTSTFSNIDDVMAPIWYT